MRNVLALAALAEIATGLALLVAPSVVGRLLIGAELVGVAVVVARVAGIALVALGLACWPGAAWMGMLVYSVAVTLLLAWVGVVDGMVGPLLWPAVGLHAIVSALLTRRLLGGWWTRS